MKTRGPELGCPAPTYKSEHSGRHLIQCWGKKRWEDLLGLWASQPGQLADEIHIRWETPSGKVRRGAREMAPWSRAFLLLQRVQSLATGIHIRMHTTACNSRLQRSWPSLLASKGTELMHMYNLFIHIYFYFVPFNVHWVIFVYWPLFLFCFCFWWAWTQNGRESHHGKFRHNF